MTEYLSRKFRILSFISILFVVLIHAYYLESAQWATCHFIQSFGGTFSNFAVPMFFAISGYLFFYKMTDGDWFKSIARKIKKRFHTLFLPYIYWILFFMGFMLLCELLPFTAPFVNGGFLDQIKTGVSLSMLCDFLVKPAAFHLWFLRDLIILVALSPLLYLLLRYFRKAFCFVLAAILVIDSLFVKSSTEIGYSTVASFFWFATGAYWGYNKLKVESKWLTRFSVLLLGCYVVLVTLLVGKYLPPRIVLIINLIGVISMWSLYDFICKGISPSTDSLLWKCSSYTFFIYCFHEPTLNIFKKLLFRALGAGQWACIVSYFLSVILMVITALIVASLLKRYTPKFYYALTGGR